MIDSKIRKVERSLGVPTGSICTTAMSFVLGDPETLQGFREYFTASSRLSALSKLHEAVYRCRGRRKFLEQKGKCANCGRNLNGQGEVDHIIPRSKGRDDRMSNLQVVCARMTGGCDYHAKKHGQ